MAITYYTGVPRSGKTYRAVDLLYKNFVLKNKPGLFSKKKKKSEYKNAQTNINQFDFKATKKITKLEFDVLYEQLSTLHEMYMDKKDDSELIIKAKEFNIYKTLFVIDECHNFFKVKRDPILTWWLTYHGHLYHEILLITQDLSLVDTEYKSIAEHFYKAVPQKFRMQKSVFKYVGFSSYKLFTKDKIGVVSVKAKSEVFKLYVSGANVNTISVYYKYLFFMTICVLLAFYTTFLFSGNISDKTGQEANESDIPVNEINPLNSKKILSSADDENQVIPKISNFKLDDKKLFKINCFAKECLLNIDSKNYEIPTKLFTKIIEDIDKQYIVLEKSSNSSIIYLLAKTDFFNFIITGDNEDEKNDNKNPSAFGIN